MSEVTESPTLTEHEPVMIAAPVDLAALSVNFPPRPVPELLRGNVINTLQGLVKDTVYAASVEGPDGMGKTTVLSQFVRRFPSTAISVFISPSNRLSFDIDLIRKDIATQAHWVLTHEVLGRDQYDALLLKSYYGDLQRHAKHSRSIIYFVLDGISELERPAREQLLQQFADTLPIGIPQFRFLFSGDDGLYRGLFGRNLAIKSYPLTEFNAEEAKSLFEGHGLTMEAVNDINSLCRGIPGRLTSVRRALDKGIPSEEFLRDAPTKWPEFFEVDWAQVDERNDQLLRILALLAHDLKPHTVAGIASTFNISEADVANDLSSVNFVSVEPASGVVHFASAGLLKFVADRLKQRKPHIQQLLIKRLLAEPRSTEALLELPSKLEEAAQYPDLLDLLTPDHLLQVLERTQTLSRVDDTVQRGFRSAKKLGRDPDLLRFGLQQSIIAEIATANTWESEIAALAALRHDKEALALANSAMLREDRLLMLATLAHGIWLRGDTVQPELLDTIKLLIEHLDYWSLGRRAGSIASKLTCVSPDLATAVLTKAKWATDEPSLDRAFVGLTVSALSDIKDASRRDQAMEIAARSRRNPSAKGLLEGVRALSGRALPEDVCARIKEIESVDAQISLLRYWCVLNSTQVGADGVAKEAIQLALATPGTRLDASLLADLSRAIAGAPMIERKKELIGMLDGVRGTAERLGPSVDYVRLQISLALAEAEIDAAASEGRLMETFDYIARIGDVPSRGEAYAAFLGGLRKLPSSMTLQSGNSLEQSCTSELEAVVLTLSEATADHYLSLGDIITGLCPGDVDKALDYTKVVNTEHRRNAVLLDVVDTLLHRSISDIDPSELKRVLDSITSADEIDQGLVHVMERFADGQAIAPEQLRALLPLIEGVENIAESVTACRAFVCAIQILEKGPGTDEYRSLRDHLTRKLSSRWEHIDVEWAQIDAGFGIVRDLAAIDTNQAEALLKAVDAIKANCGISAPKPASAFVACIRLVVRAFCGLLPRHLETEADLNAIAALIDVIPAHGERASLWADLCMRAAISGRSDITERLVKDYCLPAFHQIPPQDAAYRLAVLIQIAPAIYRAQPVTCLEAIDNLDPEARDLALRDIIRFVSFDRVPSDPTDRSSRNLTAVTYEKLLQVETLAKRLETDWMIYATAEDISELLHSPANRYSISVPQREDIARRFTALAKAKLPIAKQITHPGFRIATLAQVMTFTASKPADWSDLIEQAKALTNVADRVYVLQIIAVCLPKGMSPKSKQLLEQAKQEIRDIPSVLDRIERYLGLAERVRDLDTALCRELVNRAAVAIRESTEDVYEQQRRLVDIAYRINGDFAKKLIDEFDDDDAKRRAQLQMRLLEIREAIKEGDGKLDEEKVLRRVRAGDISRLGVLLLRSLNARRIQSYHPSEIRGYLDLVAEQPLRHAYSVLVWYVENAVTRFSDKDQASTFLRPIFDACVVGAQMAGQVAGRAMIRLRAVKTQAAAQLGSGRSLLTTPTNRDQAVRILTVWLEKNLSKTVLIHDPYFGPEDLNWIQVIRTAKSDCEITIMTARRHQPTPLSGSELSDVYSSAWRRSFDQYPPKTEIAVIGGETSKNSPIHDRWLVSGASGLRFGTSLNSLGLTKDSEISELTPEDAEQKKAELLQYLTRERSEHNGEKLRLSRFWL